MPQLDTSTWSITIVSMIITLFIMFQLKLSKYSYPSSPELKLTKTPTHTTPWESKWTKTYLPLSLPQQS
ncbi:ATP synthase F0 subunit 8 (mitochondrion) [Ceratotherium simum]|uniref:ATP synthase F(0) complex subunit 8 n=1 Tax=Ceratotherium simum TaxID=9807 RepID=ATP8_CERSI|nr:ATP synthase F0 subunit 8 [Ceratotherium simum]O03199.1 RecName: Full=ATP synthase protein 8; AltName: Full=A6L; AltName: Full=F-ATPase subunit 8 [Ceratotherium simum]CAA69010.1 ATPase8 [Ceratotherium simum]